jgi:hypothetical protein
VEELRKKHLRLISKLASATQDELKLVGTIRVDFENLLQKYIGQDECSLNDLLSMTETLAFKLIRSMSLYAYTISGQAEEPIPSRITTVQGLIDQEELSGKDAEEEQILREQRKDIRAKRKVLLGISHERVRDSLNGNNKLSLHFGGNELIEADWDRDHIDSIINQVTKAFIRAKLADLFSTPTYECGKLTGDALSYGHFNAGSPRYGTIVLDMLTSGSVHGSINSATAGKLIAAAGAQSKNEILDDLILNGETDRAAVKLPIQFLKMESCLQVGSSKLRGTSVSMTSSQTGVIQDENRLEYVNGLLGSTRDDISSTAEKKRKMMMSCNGLPTSPKSTTKYNRRAKTRSNAVQVDTLGDGIFVYKKFAVDKGGLAGFYNAYVAGAHPTACGYGKRMLRVNDIKQEIEFLKVTSSKFTMMECRYPLASVIKLIIPSGSQGGRAMTSPASLEMALKHGGGEMIPFAFDIENVGRINCVSMKQTDIVALTKCFASILSP